MRVKKEEALLAKRLFGLNFELSLVIQLQSELDLPRVVRSIAG
jgi:hypothetical protein